jgi:hypothetical protein
MVATDLEDLDELFPHTVSWSRYGGPDGYGAPSGAVVSSGSIKAHVYGRTTQFTNDKGQVIVSTLRAVLKGAPGVRTTDVFTLPGEFIPNSPKALRVAHRTDESGAHHETVFFE